jgi:hypothetical protein
VAVSAICFEGCSDKSDLTRIFIFDLPSGSWRTAVSGKGYRGSPRFTPSGEILLYAGGKLKIRSNGGFAPLDTKLLIATVKTGEEKPFALDEENFYALVNAQVGADSAIYFLGIDPQDINLKQKIKLMQKDSGQFAILPYRVPIKMAGRELGVTGSPALLEDISSFAGTSDVLRFELSADGRRIVFLSSVSVSRSRVKERIQVVEKGAARVVLTTDILTKELSLSADGRTILLLGDPHRRGRDGLDDLFLLDVDSGTIRELPLRQRINIKIENSE